MVEPAQTLDLGEDIFGLGFHFELRQVALGIMHDAEPFGIASSIWSASAR
jgi:hypothetical protein